MLAETISNGLRDASQHNALRRHRQLVCLSGGRDWAVEQVLHYLEQQSSPGCLWLGDSSPDSQVLISPVLHREARQYLGSDQANLVVDAWQGFDPDAVGALAGTLLPSGFLFLLIPPLDDWPAIQDPVISRFLSEGQEWFGGDSVYLKRLVRCLNEDDDVVLIQQGQDFPKQPEVQFESSAIDVAPPFATPDQKAAVEAITHVVKGHRRRPLVMTADRGRGKSAALGLAAARLLSEGCQKILVTASSPKAVATLFQFAEKQLTASERIGYTIRCGKAELTFIAPDELLETLPTTDLLMVDEAAAIPIPMLLEMTRRYSRIAFSSTVHGYEGTGRGFGLRFQKELSELAPGWWSTELKRPIRWGPGDPLEQSINHLLLMDAEAASDLEARQWGDVSFSWMRQSDLLKDEGLLSQVFGLLVQAHYQTSPMDLRQLLDSPDLHLCIAKGGNQVVGVVMLVAEGCLDDALQKEIFEGRRRPRGHLVLQSLIAHAGVQGIGSLRGLRIMRIAAHPQWQFQGIGKALVAQATTYAESLGMDFIASSFGATAELLRFWKSVGLRPVYLGSKRNAATGEYSAVVFRGISDAGQEHCRSAEALFHRHLVPRLTNSLQSLSFEVLAQLVGKPKSVEPSLPADLAIVEAYASGRRPFESSQAALDIWLSGQLHQFNHSMEDLDALVAKVLQGQSWDAVAGILSVPGRKAVETRLRFVVLKLLEAA